MAGNPKAHAAAAKATRTWRQKNPGVRQTSSQTREGKYTSHLKRKYGLTKDELGRILSNQKGLCAVCLKPPDKRSFVVDHDHGTGTVRGLLHQRCNVAIGFLGDDPATLDRGAAYLRKNGK
jgi:hypothetical protein